MDKSKYMTEKEVSEYTGIGIKTLQMHRLRHKGIPYIKIGRLVRYSIEEIDNFMKSHIVKNMNEASDAR